jgi:hypothetical protein
MDTAAAGKYEGVCSQLSTHIDGDGDPGAWVLYHRSLLCKRTDLNYDGLWSAKQIQFIGSPTQKKMKSLFRSDIEMLLLRDRE